MALVQTTSLALPVAAAWHSTGCRGRGDLSLGPRQVALALGLLLGQRSHSTSYEGPTMLSPLEGHVPADLGEARL